jgi:hypothetical protein
MDGLAFNKVSFWSTAPREAAAPEGSQPPLPGEDMQVPFCEGSIVRLRGLQSKPQLNGKLGRICGPPIASTGRFPVVVGNDSLLLKPQNLEAFEEEASEVAPLPDVSDLSLNAVVNASTPVSARTAGSNAGDPLPDIPDSPMWTPPDIGKHFPAASRPLPRAPDEAGEEEAEEDYFEDEEHDKDAMMAADAALLNAAINGAPQGGGGFAPLDPFEWRSTPARPKQEWLPADRRFVAELCGGVVCECDVSTPAGLAAARDAVVRRVPIVMRGGASTLLGGAAEKLGSVDAISGHLRGRAVTVLHAPPETGGRFTYYFDENAYEWNLMAPPPVNKRLSVLWDDALLAKLRTSGGANGTHYVQLGLATRAGGSMEALCATGRTPVPMRSAGPPDLLEALQLAVRSSPMGELAECLGVWQSSMLYVGPSGTLAPCHWDALDNIFSQLSGAKHVLLFPPDSPGMRPFPADHPYDSRAQVDLERPSEQELSELRGRAALATLNAGDALFIPNQWWHHIHAAAATTESAGTAHATQLVISLNCWFNPFSELAVASIPWPLRPHVHAQLARAAESLVCAALPTRAQAANAFAALEVLIAGTVEEEPPSPQPATDGKGRAKSGSVGATSAAATRQLHGMRNYVASRLCAIYGRRGALEVCRIYLQPSRWTGLKRVCFQDGR